VNGSGEAGQRGNRVVVRRAVINDFNDLGGIQKEAKAAKVKKPKTTRAKSDGEMI
jgi:hypothetical protein